MVQRPPRAQVRRSQPEPGPETAAQEEMEFRQRSTQVSAAIHRSEWP